MGMGRFGLQLLLLCGSAVTCRATDGGQASCDVVRDFGARGDNVTEDTAAVATALASCSTVVLPAGYTFLLRPVELPSNVHLVIDGNIAAWRDVYTWPNSTTKRCALTPYGTPPNETRTAPQLESLLWSADSENVSISGGGTVDGQGWRWWPLRFNQTGDEYWHNCRPKLLSLGEDTADDPWRRGVRGLEVTGITLLDSPFWTLSGRGLRGARFAGVTVRTTGCGYGEAPNTDGFNVQGEDIVIERCAVRNGDDCVPVFPPSRNVTVRDVSCTCGNGLAVVIWTALNGASPGDAGEVADVRFENVSFDRTANAVSVKSLPMFDGHVTNVSFANLSLRDVKTAVALNFLGQSRRRRLLGAGGLGAYASGVTIENVTGTAKQAGHFTCTETEPCSALAMRRVQLVAPAGGEPIGAYSCAFADGVFEDCAPEPCGWSPAAA